MSARDKVEVSTITKKLKLLADFIFYVIVVGKNIAEALFKCVDVAQIKFLLTNRLDAFHDFDKPASCLGNFTSQEKRSLPFC